MSTLVGVRDMRGHNEGSPTSIVLPNSATSATHLQDIKEEEDIELTRLNSNDSCSSKHRDTPTSSLSSVTRHNLENSNVYEDDGKVFDETRNPPTLSDEKAGVRSKTASTDDLSLLPPLPKTIENVISGHTPLEARDDLSHRESKLSSNDNGPLLDVDAHNNTRIQNHALAHTPTHNTSIIDFKSPQVGSLQLGDHGDFINTIESDQGIIETLGAPFDLSKALEIPNSFSNTTHNTHNQEANGHSTGFPNASSTSISASNSESVHSSPPNIASPKVSTKKKFSSVLLNSDLMAIPQDNSPSEISQFHDSKLYGLRSKSNSNAASFQHLLPNFNMGLDTASIESNANENLNYFSSSRISYDKRSARKFSTDNSSNSSFSNTSISDELLYKLPPKLNRSSFSRSRSNSNTNVAPSNLSLDVLGHGPSTPAVLNGSPAPGSYFSVDTNKNMKKVPLLRRASTALLRKTSVKSNINCFEKDFQRSRSASTTPVLPNSSFFDTESIRRTPPLNKQKYCSSFVDNEDSGGYFPTLSAEDGEDDLHYVTQLNGNSRPSSRNPSIRSRMRKGISRIMSSSGSVRRAVSTSSLKTDMLEQGFEDHQRDMKNEVTAFPSPLGVFPIDHRGSPVKKRTPESRFVGDDKVDASRSSSLSVGNSSPAGVRVKDSTINVTPISTSTTMSPVVSSLMQISASVQGKNGNSMGNKFDQVQAKAEGVSSGSNNTRASKVDGSEKKNCKKLQMGDNKREYDVTVDLDKLTKSIPIITVTGNINSRSCIPIQQQSNIFLDEVYMGRSKKTYEHFSSGNETDSDSESDKPKMMTLKEYVGILMKQQQIEDERLAILEKSFVDSGWCSKEDLNAIKQKRVIISKKWAERISFYQGKLDF